MYKIEDLINQMVEFKESTTNIEKGDVFISIYRAFPITKIRVELTKEKNSNGDLITTTDNIYKSNIACIYKYSEETISIILNWQQGYNLISDIHQQLTSMDISDILKIKQKMEEKKQ